MSTVGDDCTLEDRASLGEQCHSSLCEEEEILRGESSENEEEGNSTSSDQPYSPGSDEGTSADSSDDDDDNDDDNDDDETGCDNMDVGAEGVPESCDEHDDSGSVVFGKLDQSLCVQKRVEKRGKRHSCVYCEKLYDNIARHMERMHSDQNEVAKILNFPKGSKERRVAWGELVNKGDYNHNRNALSRGTGVIIPKYRPRAKGSENASIYLPCQFCYGMYIKSDLWKHQKTCSTKLNKGEKSNMQPVIGGKLLLPCSSGGRKRLYADVLLHMRDDDVKEIVSKDSIILEYGDRLYEHCLKEVHAFNYISTKLRELGRLVKVLMKYHHRGLQDALTPAAWHDIVAAAKEVGGYDEASHAYACPSLPIKLGHSLKKCAEIKLTNCMVNGDGVGEAAARGIIELITNNRSDRIGKGARNTLEDRHYNKPKLLPLMEDVSTLHQYLDQRSASLRTDCERSPREYYPDLAQTCLTQVILFNRKRAGEAQRMKVSNFRNAITNASETLANSEISQALSKFELELCKTHLRVEIKGKRSRKVPILLTEDMIASIKVILDSQEAAGVSGSKYVFARPCMAKHPYRGDRCLRYFARESGAKEPHLLTSTSLRKQLAVMCQLLNLKDNHMDMLATFMGHDITIHRKFYRLPEDVLQMAKVAKVLHAINGGTVCQYQGKDFDDIGLDPDGT